MTQPMEYVVTGIRYISAVMLDRSLMKHEAFFDNPVARTHIRRKGIFNSLTERSAPEGLMPPFGIRADATEAPDWRLITKWLRRKGGKRERFDKRAGKPAVTNRGG